MKTRESFLLIYPASSIEHPVRLRRTEPRRPALQLQLIARYQAINPGLPGFGARLR